MRARAQMKDDTKKEKKKKNLSSCRKLGLSTSLTHDLIAQSIRASERNLVVVGSNPTQDNFL